jgi:hypothetical protein
VALVVVPIILGQVLLEMRVHFHQLKDMLAVLQVLDNMMKLVAVVEGLVLLVLLVVELVKLAEDEVEQVV